jgi:hypothetical protein
MGKQTVKEVAPEPQPSALPTLEVFLDMLGVSWADVLARLQHLQDHNPQVPLSASDIAGAIEAFVGRAGLINAFTKAGVLAAKVLKEGHGENAHDPSASA